MKLRQIGNSTGVTFPKDILRKAGMEEGDEVEIQASRGEISIRKHREGVTVDLSKEEAVALSSGDYDSRAGKSALSKVRKAAK